MDPLVEEIVEKIAAAFHPARVVLFGSRARGEAGPESDVDLLVVYDGPQSRREVEIGIRRLFTPQTFSMDLIVLSSDEFQRQKRVISTIGHIADREGVLCHVG
jgi:predicted nucleotidyltransferase